MVNFFLLLFLEGVQQFLLPGGHYFILIFFYCLKIYVHIVIHVFVIQGGGEVDPKVYTFTKCVNSK